MTNRFQSVEDIRRLTVANDRDCWVWVRRRDRDGYGMVAFRGSDWRVHRLVYTIEFGPIPDGFTVDHQCFNRACANPKHLRLLTWAENARRQRLSLATHCKHGHEYTPENTRTRGSTGRVCRACAAQRSRAYRARKLGS